MKETDKKGADDGQAPEVSAPAELPLGEAPFSITPAALASSSVEQGVPASVAPHSPLTHDFAKLPEILSESGPGYKSQPDGSCESLSLGSVKFNIHIAGPEAKIDGCLSAEIAIGWTPGKNRKTDSHDIERSDSDVGKKLHTITLIVGHATYDDTK